jgi:hypothetical protein
MVDHPHHRAAWAPIFGYSQRVAGRFMVQAAPAGADRCRAQGVPGAGRMVIGGAGMQRDAGADGDLVTQRQAGQEFGPVQPHLAIGEGRQRRQQCHPGMALCQAVTVMGIDAVDHRRPGHRGACRRGAPPVHQDADAAIRRAEIAMGESAEHAPRFRLRARRRDPGQIQQAAPRLAQCRFGNVPEFQPQNEIGNGRRAHGGLLGIGGRPE